MNARIMNECKMSDVRKAIFFDLESCHSQADTEYLIAALRKSYEIIIDWKGTNYCGLTLSWEYKNKTIDIAMPGYIP